MSLLEAFVLGIVQGLTEFLPVSSSGHLELVKYLFDSNLVAKESLLFTVAVHAATALSTIVIFRKDILEIFRGLFQFQWNESARFSWFIVLSMIPAAFIGVFFEDFIDQLFSGQILLVGLMLMLTALLLSLADRAKNTNKSVGWKEALLVGVAQAIAIMPGVSRSGATISASVILGIDRTKAARFSFLMVVPLILGKIAKDMLGGEFSLEDDKLIAIAIGSVAAFIAGLLACKWMIRLVQQSNLYYFAIYCFVVGGIAIISQLIS